MFKIKVAQQIQGIITGNTNLDKSKDYKIQENEILETDPNGVSDSQQNTHANTQQQFIDHSHEEDSHRNFTDFQENQQPQLNLRQDLQIE